MIWKPLVNFLNLSWYWSKEKMEERNTVRKYVNLYWDSAKEDFFLANSRTSVEECEKLRMTDLNLHFIRVIPLEYTLPPKIKVKKEGWINIYTTEEGNLRIGAVYKSPEDATKRRANPNIDWNFIECKKIEVEVYE